MGKDFLEAPTTVTNSKKPQIISDDRNASGPYLPPGKSVRYDDFVGGGPEYGIVVHCWLDDQINAHDRYVAFFGDEQPIGKPLEKPYILRYASISPTIIDAAAP